jgi:hypothetical protein
MREFYIEKVKDKNQICWIEMRHNDFRQKRKAASDLCSIEIDEIIFWYDATVTSNYFVRYYYQCIFAPLYYRPHPWHEEG